MIASLGEKKQFQAGGELTPEERAFDSSVYDEGDTVAVELLTSGVMVVGSPTLTGKTTQLNLYTWKAHELDSNIESIRIDFHGKGVNEARLRQKLAEELQPTEVGSFSSMVESSRRIDRHKRTLLVLIGVDALDVEALRWLLSGLVELDREGDVLRANGVKVLIDGSFSVQTLTAGPNSEFPLRQLFPREFLIKEQQRFLENRFRAFGFSVSAKAATLIWSLTRGDKYLTQVLSLALGPVLATHGGSTVDELHVEEARDLFLQEGSSGKELKSALWKQILSLPDPYGLLDFLGDPAGRWDRLAPDQKAVHYKAGSIRRVGEESVELRAPIVLDLIKDALVRLKALDGLLGVSLEVTGVARGSRPEARRSIKKIRTAALWGRLLDVHVGGGVVDGTGRVAVELRTLSGMNYDAVVSMHRRTSYQVGEEVWVLLWTQTSSRETDVSELSIWPVEPIDELFT